MPKINASELLARLGKGKAPPAILLLGDEPYLRDTCRARLIERFVPEAARTWAVSRYSAERGETQAALEQAQTLPMLSPQQVVFLEDVQSIEKLGDKSRDAAVDGLQAYLNDPAAFTLLVLEAKALDQRMKLARMLAESVLVVECSLGEDPEKNRVMATGLARAMAGELNVEFETGAAEELAEAVAQDLERLKTEVAKLATYAGQRKLIRRQDIAAMVISEKTRTVWEMVNMLASRQGKQALEFLECLLRDGEEPLQMLGAITWMYRKLVEATELRGVNNGWQAARALAMRPEQAELALAAARKMGKSRLLEGLRSLQRADDRLKRGGENTRTVLEFLVAELTVPGLKAAARD
jgi:DNA polymerase III subunit delta